MPDEKYFPWHSFQLWLREGVFAAFLLNKVMIASWPRDKWLKAEPPFPLQSYPEEIDFLKAVLVWIDKVGKENYRGVVKSLSELGPGKEYPKLENEEARLLWQAVSEYGTATQRYENLHTQLKHYLANFGDADTAIKKGMDGLWRSIGPALDPDRSNIEKAALEKAA